MSAPPSGNEGLERAFRPQRPLVIGLVGGVAAGKSTVANLFAAHGIRHVDADFHARLASQEASVVQEVAAQLGNRFVQHGQLDRAALAEHVFADPTAKAQLEAIVHPRVHTRIVAELDAARRAGESSLLDVPLLFEAGLSTFCDTIVFVATSDAVRAQRASERGWAADELARRENNQLPLAEKRARSQHVIDNDKDLAETKLAVHELLIDLEANA